MAKERDVLDSALFSATVQEALTGMADRFSSSALRSVELPDVINAARASGLAENLASRDDFEAVYGLLPDCEQSRAETRGVKVSAQAFSAAQEWDRYFTFAASRSWSYRRNQLRLDQSCPLGISELDALLTLFEQVSSLRLSMLRVMPQRFISGDFVGGHHENRLGRTLTGHLALTPQWDATTHGARLRIWQEDGTVEEYLHEFNSLVVFDVRAHWRQEITPVTGGPFHMLLMWAYENDGA
jgi:hypothetical protein